MAFLIHLGGDLRLIGNRHNNITRFIICNAGTIQFHRFYPLPANQRFNHHAGV